MATAASVLALTGVSCTKAQTAQYDLPAEALGQALKDLARKGNVRVVAASDLIAGKTSSAVVGAHNADEALSSLLVGTGLHAELVAGAYVIRQDPSTGLAGASPPDKDIVVTGTRIHGEAPIGTPLIVIDRGAIEESGHATVADYIQTLPQNYAGGANEGNFGNNGAVADNIAFGSSINLRGLGTESTLLLFDGGRPALGGSIGSFVDTSLIPTSAIDRIEILTDGASAIYGTDAVAGVVNMRFRDRYDGFETHLYSGVAGVALHQQQISQIGGKRWSSGGLMLAYQYDHRSRLSGDSRSFWTEDLTPWGGPDNREPYATPGTITAANGEKLGIPAGQDGRSLTAADLIAGQTNVQDQRRGVDILPSQTTHSLYAAGDQNLSAGVSLYARALYAHRAFDATSQPVSFQPFTVPTTNPFYVDPIGTDEPVSVQYDFARDVGHFETRGHLSAITTSAGVKANWGSWHFDLGGTYGHQSTKDDRFNSLSSRRIQIALADTNPTTALNLFGDGTGNNPATIDFIRADYRDFSRATAWSGALRADGMLFRLPAGDVRIAVGFEHRHESFSAGYYYNTSEADPSIYDLYETPGAPGRRHIDAVYAEASIPVFNAADKAFPGKLDLSLAGRTDWYSDVGRTINPKAGLSWKPAPGVTVRGSWGTSFRAPTFNENAGPGGNYYYSYEAPDSHSATGTTPVILIEGYSDHIRPEKSTTWTAGFDLKPSLAPGLTLSATYFDIAYRDRIAYPSDYLAQILSYPNLYASLIETPTAAQVAAIYASPQFINAFGIDASDIRYILHQEAQNLSRQTVRGVDFTVAYSHAVGGGTGVADISGTRLFTFAQKITDATPSSNLLGTIYNPVRWRFRAHGGWSGGGFSADAFVNYTGGYRNLLVTPEQHVKSWTTLDGQIAYRFGTSSALKGARIALSATNLLNTKPPYVDYELYNLTMGYDPNSASAVGREISLDLTFQW
jgi:outer membrane receptor protein involved in Fe transport